jgi:two-component system chemotaxis sensor kinase CheA
LLIAEDSFTSRGLLKTILEAAGYQVATANDGLEAWNALKQEPFDLLISDVEMPRMDGFMLADRVRADPNLARLPIVLVTALESDEDRARGLEAGANAYLVKSGFAQDSLLDAIRRLI